MSGTDADATGATAGTGTGTGTPPAADADLVDALTRLFANACRQLGNAGDPSEALRIAAQGWSLLREPYPRHAERIDGAMHYLARLEQKLEQKLDG